MESGNLENSRGIFKNLDVNFIVFYDISNLIILQRQSFQDYVLNVLQQKKVPRERIWKLVEKYPENFPEFYDRVIETGDTESK